ncbi:MAG TPA: tetratricopeptide repeat protein [Candidatus Udaeobacter sp.]|nr:tetratricopeptide repeat protein [Candidatus Udaeobacter sp.]
MSLFAKLLVVVGATLCFLGGLHATGYYGPDFYLDDGGKNVAGSPEFYWGLEVRRLAKEFHPTEKRVVSEKAEQKSDEDASDNSNLSQTTEEADLNDFDAALKEGRIKPPDPTKAKDQHKLARATITSTSPTAEFDSEFADYHRGAGAFLNKNWDEARKAWEELLKRPEQDRHYRTVWAAFMLGKLALKTQDYPSASQWFQRAREFAKAGFADSLGLAAESYGWEGRAEWKQEHPGKAAPLFLTQLALGDPSAVVSLKALIPDREPVEGMLNYGPEADERSSWNDEQKKEEEQKETSKLKAAAQDPLLRRLITVHILATATSPDLYPSDSEAAPVNRCARWLDIIKQANLGRIEDAEYLGWVAYNNGDYKGAAHWLELSKGDSGTALWLRAKLQRRAGKLAKAANTMAQAVESLRTASAYNPTGGTDEKWTEYDYFPEGPDWGWGQSAHGDLGGLRLVRGDFVQAFDTLFKGHLWNDAAFVAERVLTTNELKEYVDALPETPPPKQGEDYNAKLRYLLGRRLVREDRYAEAGPYMSPPYDKVLEKYVKALKDGANEKLSKAERAHAWFTAAWLARYDGMELMGTEVAPDAFADSGAFEFPDLAKQRRSGFYQQVSYDTDGNQKKKNVPIPLKASQKEIQRLTANKIEPDIRFHYRLIAGALAIKAAALLPDNSEELADVVNQAGLWVKDRDEKIGNRYYQIIERRCAKTRIGQADMVKHWFTDQTGPWSTAEEEAYRAMHKELKIDSSD